jgi:hypothetical protein
MLRRSRRLVRSAGVVAALAIVLIAPKHTATPSASAAQSPLVYVTASGSDVNPCTQVLPCRSFNRAYHVAQPGNIVEVAGGSYPLQKMTRDASKLNAPSDVTFQAASGAMAIVAGIYGDGITRVVFLGNSRGDLTNPTSGLTLRTAPTALDTGADVEFANCASHVTVKNLDMRRFFITSSDTITIEGGTVGGYDNSSGDSAITGAYQGRGTATCVDENPFAITIHNVLFHDVLRTLAPTAHPDCLQFSGTTGTVIDGNRFVRCGTADIMARPALNIWTGNQLTGLVLQNNFFMPPVEGGPATVLGGTPDTCGRIDVVNNSAVGSISAYSCGSYSQLDVVGNLMTAIPSYTCSTALAKPHVSFQYDVFEAGRPCGTHSAVVATRSTWIARTATCTCERARLRAGRETRSSFPHSTSTVSRGRAQPSTPAPISSRRNAHELGLPSGAPAHFVGAAACANDLALALLRGGSRARSRADSLERRAPQLRAGRSAR